MKFLLSLSLIPLLLLTNVSAAVTLQLPTYIHEYENPTTEDGFPFLAIRANDPFLRVSKSKSNFKIFNHRADILCALLGHNKAWTILEEDIQYNFEGKAYFQGEIVDTTEMNTRVSSFLGSISKRYTNGIFKVLRCVDY